MSESHSTTTAVHRNTSYSIESHPRTKPREEAVVVCCGFRPVRPFRRRIRKLRRKISVRLGRNADKGFFDAQEVEQPDILSDIPDDWDRDSLFFFDAEQEELGRDEYPVVFTNSLQHPKPTVSLDRPESLLAPSDAQRPSKTAAGTGAAHKVMSIRSAGDADDKLIDSHGHYRRYESVPINFSRPHSQRFLSIPRRSTLENQQALETPRVKIPYQGYPGGLTVSELAECQKFVRGLKELDPQVYEQVYSLRDVEEEPYTICRWLRATKFDAAKILERLDSNQEMFEAARKHSFYPDVAKTIGAPFPVFLSQYPFLCIGRGKNGCPVNYFQIGKINPEGIMALTTQEGLQGYFWWSFMYKFKEEIRKAQAMDPDFVRAEGINILDLKGLSSASLSSETIDVIKLASQISDFFPETLHCMLILNVPGFFSMFWGLIKKFIDPRTASRIQVFSNTEKGLAALRQMVDSSEIPVDYGGTNVSIKEAFVEEAADPLLKRQELELFHVKRRGQASSKQKWELQTGEYMDISVYTRSISGAKITVSMGGQVQQTKEARCGEKATPLASDPAAKAHVAPNATLIVSELQGPGVVELIVEDLDDADKKFPSNSSRGYFLAVGDVKSI